MTTILNTQSTKEEETQALRHMKQIAGENSYLSGLFTDDFMIWAEQQIKDDFTINVFDDWQSTEKQLSEKVVELRQVTEEHTQEKGYYKKEVDRIHNLLQAEKDQVTRLTNQLTDRVEEQAVLIEANDRMGAFLIEDKNSEIAALELTVMKLKAQLYDLEHEVQ